MLIQPIELNINYYVLIYLLDNRIQEGVPEGENLVVTLYCDEVVSPTADEQVLATEVLLWVNKRLAAQMAITATVKVRTKIGEVHLLKNILCLIL